MRTQTTEKHSKAVERTPGFSQALDLFREASRRVPAYRDFLASQKIDADKIKTPTDFAQVPPTDKDNYFTQYSLAELSWDGQLDAKYVSSSSGSTGQPFFWPRGATQDELVGDLFKKVYERIFDTCQGRTLAVNSFGLGAWIAGFELYNATKWTADRGSAITIVTPSLDPAEAIRQIKRLQADFDRVILCGYPPFVKDILDLGIESGVDWMASDTRLFTAGEAISEAWRDRMLEVIGQPGSFKHVINYYGMAETGTVGHETPATILLRRAVADMGGGKEFERFGGFKTAAIYQYDPAIRFFEGADDDNLLLTSPAGLPLIRYNTRDRGGLVGFHEAKELVGLEKFAEKAGYDMGQWTSPFVYLFGRRDLSATLYAVIIYPENIKAALEDHSLLGQLSGMFVMETKNYQNMDQYLEVSVELAPGKNPNQKLKAAVTDLLVMRLRQLNAEYNRLYAAVGSKAIPEVALIEFGKLDYTPGRKHRWVKRG